MSIYKKLMEARIQLQNKKLTKSGHNKFAGYQYFELGDFLPVVQTIFSEIGICGVVSYTGETASLTIHDFDSDATIVFTSPMGSAALKGCHEVQNIGAVETYQRRYLWVTAMEIVEHDALDAVVGKDEKKPITPTTGAWESLSVDEQTFLRDIAVEVIAFIEDEDVAGAVDFIESKNLDAEEKIALWTRFDSKQRSAMKRESESRKSKSQG